MNLGELKTWLNTLPEEFDKFEIVNGDFGVLNDQYHYRVDKPILACTVDDQTKEIIFMHQTDKELTEDDIKAKEDGDQA
jgi:hypothetical protein